MSKKKKRSRSKGRKKKFQYKKPQVAAPRAIDEEYAEAQQAKADEKERKAKEALIEKAKAVQRELEAAEAKKRKAEAEERAGKDSKDEKAKGEEAKADQTKADASKESEDEAKEQRAEERRAKERRSKLREEEERRAKDRRSEGSESSEEKELDQLPGPPSFWRRNDLSVLLFAIALFVGGTFLTRHLATPKRIDFDSAGLHFERPTGWLPAQQIRSKAAGLAGTTSGFGTKAPTPQTRDEDLHLIYQSARDSRLRIEVHIGPRPAYRNLRGARAIERLGRYGEFYWEAESGNRSIARRDWVRSEFRYAFKPSKSGSPQIANAVEYATIQDKRLYVVTLHGEAKSMQDLDKLISPTLRIRQADAQTGGRLEASGP